MNQQVEQFQFPNPPRKLAMSRSPAYHELVSKINEHTDWVNKVTVKMTEWTNKIHAQINSQVQGVGNAIPAAATISPTNPIHHVTGGGAISTINAPQGFSGPVWLIADGAFSLATGGNISMAKGPFAVGQAVRIIYDPNKGMWYPE